MGIIFVISPDFLSVIAKEAKNFSFRLQGYGSFKLANKGIIRTNSEEIIGIAYVGSTIPEKGKREYKEMFEFMKRCDSLQPSKKMVFVLLGGFTGLGSIIKHLKNLRIYESSDHMFMTDTIIKQNVFASLLLDSRSVYKISDEKSDSTKTESFDLLHYESMLSPQVLACLEDIHLLDNWEDTLLHDQVYHELEDAGSFLLAAIRKLKIMKAFGEFDKQLFASITDQVSSIKDDMSWCIYNVLGGV